MKRSYLIGLILTGGLAVLLVSGYFNRSWILSRFLTPTQTAIEQSSVRYTGEIVATDLDTPWEIAFLPSGNMIVTERSGTVKLFNDNQVVLTIPNVIETSEGGLLGMAIHPKFSENRKIYFYYTTSDGSAIINRLESFQLKDNILKNPQLIIPNIPGSNNHDGGRIAFGPDGYLYVATGDAGNENNAQDKNSLAGKILRVADDGSIPADNPFNNAVYSYGHRNPQGLAWDASGNLWSSEHGPSGFQSGFDELNKIVQGGNYGWPVIKGDEKREGMIGPLANSGSDDTWAPAGLAYYNSKLYFTGLRGQSLYEVTINGQLSAPTLQTLLKEKYGRLRALTAGPDGYLYVSTSNRDGRGDPAVDDDKIIRIKFE